MRIRHETRSGFAVVVKTAQSPSDAARLANEHSTLSRLQLPGVTQLHHAQAHSGEPYPVAGPSKPAPSPEAQLPELTLRYVGRHSLATFSTPRDWEWLGLFWRGAQLLAQLHQQGLCHGAIAPSHVLVGQYAQPVLCSFGRAVMLADDGSLAHSDVASFIKTANDVLGRLPAAEPAWAHSLRHGRPRLLSQLKTLFAGLSDSRTTTAAALAHQLGQLAEATGHRHSFERYQRELAPAIRAPAA